MSDSEQERAEEIFLAAVELSPADRRAYVERECGDDPELRLIVNSFLEADEAAGDANFLESHLLGGASPDSDSVKEERSVTSDQSSPSDSRFQILARHDQGGLGEVLIAHDRQLNREVAVKQIRPKWIDVGEARERFVQEAEVTGRLEHPGVVPVYAMGTWEDGRPFYAMRFVQGLTLKKVIAKYRESSRDQDRQTKRMELRDLLNRFVDVCNTIEYAHSRQVLHRDIKPSNIMIGPYGETLVVDWGLAKLLDAPFDESLTAGFIAENSKESGSSRTRVGGTVGTPQYMSPEQACGDLESIGVCTDVYLLGATLYQILTGVAPHSEASVSKLIERVKGGLLTRPRSVDPDVPAPLEAVCMRAMSHDPADRYRSSADLAREIERWLADQPVSVFRDPASVRLGRWIRRHRTLAMSGAVAAVLITVGSLAGSMLWSYQRSQQLRVEKERNLKDAQLIASREQRVNELRESGANALDLSLREIQAGRFNAGLNILRSSSDALAAEPSLADQRIQLQERAKRLDKIVEFYRQSELCEQYNATSRDTEGIMSSSVGLKALGIWDQKDWWAKLPAEDLTPEQTDRLRWDVYQQWLMLDGMLIKTIGTRLFGTSQSGSSVRILSALRKMRSSAGKREALAALVVSDRIDWFRQSESARWYRGIAHYRLGSGRRVKGEEVGPPRNPPDAQKLGVLCMLSAMDESFAVVFRDYQGKEPIVASRDLFQHSASLRPDHYWTQISLGQMQYFSVLQESEPTWESYQPAVQTMGRCIAINPDSCFAFADRSSLFRFQWERMLNASSVPADERDRRAAELLKWSLQDGETAYRLAADQPWVGWTYGMALSAAGQTDQAIDVFLEASLRTLPLMQNRDAALIRADDIRGRAAAAEYALDLISEHPANSSYHVVLASIRLNQQDIEDASTQIESALAGSISDVRADIHAHAYAIRGMLFLEAEEFDRAVADFGDAINLNPDHIWALYGTAVCNEQSKEYSLALDGYKRALLQSLSDEHRIACLLGIGRTSALLDEYGTSRNAIEEAHAIQPACDIESVARPLLERFRELRAASSDGEGPADLYAHLEMLGMLIRSSKIVFENEDSESDNSLQAPLLNGNFELPGLRYWSDELGMAWQNTDGYRGAAERSMAEHHEGVASLRIIGDDLRGAGQGSTYQEFPVPANSRIRVSIWAKARELDVAALQMVASRRISTDGAWTDESTETTSFDLAEGSYDWRSFEFEFSVGEAPDPAQNIVPVRLMIVSSGSGEAFLDGILVEATRE